MKLRLLPCCFALLSLTALTASLSAAPIGLWHFDETSGAIAADASGSGLNLSIYGTPGRVAGQANGALQFNGTTTYAKVPNSQLLDGTDKLTISFWVKPANLDGTAQFIVAKRSSSTAEQAYSMYFGEGGKLFFDINRSSDADRFTSNTIFQNEQWYKVELVYDGTANLSQRARLYVNGKLDRQAPVPSSFIPHKNSDLYVGIGNAGYTTKFKGIIDELSISRTVPEPEQLAEEHRGLWTLERWSQMNYDEVEKLTADLKFYQTPASVQYLGESGADLETSYRGVRMRGLLEAPTTGNYVFWLSASASAELYLSDDSAPYRKQRISRLSPIAGTGTGVKLSDPNRWDQFDSQMSEPVALQAGRKYYIEIIGQTNHAGTGSHFHLAWAPPGQARAPIPGNALSYYVIESGDADDDSLPDAWESQYGLDAADNGALDILRQGERGDFDGDGLSNREEYLLGTNPASKDTDGDSKSDFEETKVLHTNPSINDLPREAIASVAD